jgi:hypothetical protein
METNLVPVFIWRIPLRYYQRRPAYFQGWNADEAPRWDQHWGADWKRHHPDWQQWDRQSVPAASPPPGHQKNDAPAITRARPGNRPPLSSRQPHATLRLEPTGGQASFIGPAGNRAGAPCTPTGAGHPAPGRCHAARTSQSGKPASATHRRGRHAARRPLHKAEAHTPAQTWHPAAGMPRTRHRQPHRMTSGNGRGQSPEHMSRLSGFTPGNAAVPCASGFDEE